MTKTDCLNTASDLRRIAYWLAVNERGKKALIKRFYDEAWGKPEIRTVLRHYGADFDPGRVFRQDNRLFFAEQLLISSNRLQEMAI